ncbi:MAG: hypothetical protein IJH99_03365 [Eubacterium sp.]|nr:hypothetical protein [Eubacterium sp.]
MKIQFPLYKASGAGTLVQLKGYKKTFLCVLNAAFWHIRQNMAVSGTSAGMISLPQANKSGVPPMPGSFP